MLLQAAFLNLVGAEGFERVGEGQQGDLGEGVDEPFCGVVLVPDYGVAVVGGEFVVEVVVAGRVNNQTRVDSTYLLSDGCSVWESWTYPSPIVTSAVST